MVKEKHVMDWDSVRIVVKENEWSTRGITESIVIRKNPQNINRDEDRNLLSHRYHAFLLVEPQRT